VVNSDNKKELREIREAIIWQTQRMEQATAKSKGKVINQIRVDTKWGEYLNTEVFHKR
jgi:hypothetical protein